MPYIGNEKHRSTRYQISFSVHLCYLCQSESYIFRVVFWYPSRRAKYWRFGLVGLFLALLGGYLSTINLDQFIDCSWSSKWEIKQIKQKSQLNALVPILCNNLIILNDKNITIFYVGWMKMYISKLEKSNIFHSDVKHEIH